MELLLILLLVVWAVSSAKKPAAAPKKQPAGTPPSSRTSKTAEKPAAHSETDLRPVSAGASSEGTRHHHVLKPAFEAGHAHTESSIDGVYSECDVPNLHPDGEQYHDPVLPDQAAASCRRPSMTPSDLRRAVILSEIIGKPKALSKQ